MASYMCQDSIVIPVTEIVTKEAVVLRNFDTPLNCVWLSSSHREQTHVQCNRHIVSSETIYASVSGGRSHIPLDQLHFLDTWAFTGVLISP
jgi:hypothetical protein